LLLAACQSRWVFPSPGLSAQEDASEPEAAQPQQARAEEEPAPVDKAASAERQAQAAANAEKEAGNVDYKAKRFDEAVAHYTRCVGLGVSGWG
jgi:stress-induced-phosphoprotein 1